MFVFCRCLFGAGKRLRQTSMTRIIFKSGLDEEVTAVKAVAAVEAR
jgi:hypothetical protein